MLAPIGCCTISRVAGDLIRHDSHTASLSCWKMCLSCFFASLINHYRFFISSAICMRICVCLMNKCWVTREIRNINMLQCIALKRCPWNNDEIRLDLHLRQYRHLLNLIVFIAVWYRSSLPISFRVTSLTPQFLPQDVAFSNHARRRLAEKLLTPGSVLIRGKLIEAEWRIYESVN